jgi:SM-20-related protein
MEAFMSELNYDAMRETPVVLRPFPHIVVPNFVPEPKLQKVIRDLPEFTKGGSFPVDSLHLGADADGLIRELEGETFRQIVTERFALDLRGAPTMVTLRGQSREKDGRIHCDSTAKRVTVLLYLNPRGALWARQEGCLRLLRSSENIEDYEVEVAPVDGTLLVFPNGPATWHGHKQFVGRRYVVQLNYMSDDQAARSEIRRHRLSAIMKRLSAV